MGNLLDLSGKKVLVTGGNGGIGLGMAAGLAMAGADVAIWGRNASRNAAAVEELQGYGNAVYEFVVDVANETQVVGGFADTVEALDHVDCVFANAGIGGITIPFDELTAEDWRSVLAPNLEGVLWTFREAVRHMKPRGRGSLVVTSSTSADFGFPRNESYSVTKAGVRALIRSLAVEYGAFGIRANAIAPGWVVTGMTDGFIEGDSFSGRVLSRIPVGRFGQPEDFAGIAVYLASDASRWHTGDTIIIDGGHLRT